LAVLLSCLLSTLSEASPNTPSLRIGLEKFRPPFIYEDTSKLYTGYEVKLAKHLCKDLKVQCSYHYFYTQKEIFKALKKNHVDVILDGIVPEQKRPGQIISIPYFISQSRILSPQNTTFNALQKTKKASIAFIKFRSGIAEFLSQYPGDYNLLEYPIVQSAMNAISSNNSLFFLIDDQTATYITNNMQGFHLIGPIIQTNRPYSILTNASKRPLIEKINQFLLKYENDGTYERLYKDFIVK